MITVRRAEARQHERRDKQEYWFTFGPPRAPDTPDAGGFGAIELLKEGRLAPRAGIRQPSVAAEIVTYVREGTLGYQDSAGQSGVLCAGEFQRMTVGPDVRYSETNASPSEWAHVFQIWLRPSTQGLEPGHEQKRFSNADRRGRLCLVASRDAHSGSLHICQDVQMYSAVLKPGRHIIHALSPGRRAWLHIVQGWATLGEVSLRTGDGAGVEDEPTVSLTAREDTEILLLDLGGDVASL
jgi:redox-sensitive bicupin YhaK (pirin superfamily)